MIAILWPHVFNQCYSQWPEITLIKHLPGGPGGILGGILIFGGSPGGGPGGSPDGLPGGGPGGNIRGIGPLIGLNIIGGTPGGGPKNKLQYYFYIKNSEVIHGSHKLMQI